jgi:HemY protein
MRRILGALIVAALVIAAAWWIAGIPGNFAATVAGYTVETSAPVALVGLVVVVLVLHVLLRLISGVLRLPRRYSNWRARRRRIGGDRAVTRTLVALAAGEQGTARSEAAKARRLLGDTAQTLLHAAEAARLSGHDEEAAAFFRLLADREDAAFIGLRGLFRQAMARKDWNEAARLAKQAEELHPGAGWLRTERSELAVRLGNWQQAIALAGPDTPTAAFAVAAAQDEPNIDRAIRMARRATKDYPDFVPAVLVHATKLRQSGRESRAQAVLRAAWKANPHPDIAALVIAPVSDPTQRLKDGTRLAQANPGHPESLFLIASLALAAGKIDEARSHAEAARNAGMNQQRLWKLMSDIDLAEQGGTALANPRLEALRLATSADADPGWRCEVCGTGQSHWMPACPVCDTPGRISWGIASRPKLLASN